MSTETTDGDLRQRADEYVRDCLTIFGQEANEKDIAVTVEHLVRLMRQAELPTVTEMRGILKGYPVTGARDSVCTEILDIMRTYHEQDAKGWVDTPGGLEHMGDVWRLFLRWEEELLNEQS